MSILIYGVLNWRGTMATGSEPRVVMASSHNGSKSSFGCRKDGSKRRAGTGCVGVLGAWICLVTLGLHICTCTALKFNLIRSKPAVEIVPRGQAHHIYKANVSAEVAWTPCSPGQFPAGHWTAQDDRATRTGSQLYGTALAQRFIWAHQHPKSCSAARFLLYHPHVSGIGSVVHHMGQALALAIELNRTLVVAPDVGYPYTDTESCGLGSAWDECYFEQMSSCTWRDALNGTDQEPNCIQSPSMITDPSVRSVCFQGYFTADDYSFQAVPPQFKALLRASPVRPDKWYYWWRAQSAAYIVRPNARLRNEIEARKRRAFAGERVRSGTISVHVRHGDKYVESALVEDGVYLRVAEEMYKAQQNLSDVARTERLRHRIFLSTEDPQTVEAFGAAVEWDVQVTDIMRESSATSTLAHAAAIGPYEEMLNSLMNLDLALQGDGFVGTLSSNWCRLIDELRATVRCKAHAPYLDAQQDKPPYDVDW